MRQIKFRGRNLKGELVYGSYYYEHFTDTPKEIHAIISEYGVEWRVKPNSVVQLVGIDANEKEVYEGDKVIRIAGDEDFNPEKTFPMAASIEDYAAIRDEEIVLVEAAT